MVTESQKKSTAKYDKENTRGIYLKLNLKTDADILDYLDSLPPERGGKQGYIKALIRADIEKNRC